MQYNDYLQNKPWLIKDSENIDVSVVIATYNHEKYIKHTIESVMMQKINFNIEVLIGEDCSTDGTRKILKKLEGDLPDNYHIFYREKNLNEDNFFDLFKKTKGRYMIVLEGDDYWIDENKLQIQFDFMESHPEYVACAHNCMVVDENENKLPTKYPECNHQEYTAKDFRNGLLPGQTASLFCVNYSKYNLFDYLFFKDVPYPGDRKKCFYLVANGRIFCFQKSMSAYRYVTNSGSSFSATIRHVGRTVLRNREWKYIRSVISYLRLHDVLPHGVKYFEQFYYWKLFLDTKKKDIDKDVSFLAEWKFCRHKFSVLLYLCRKTFQYPFKKLLKKSA